MKFEEETVRRYLSKSQLPGFTEDMATGTILRTVGGLDDRQIAYSDIMILCRRSKISGSKDMAICYKLSNDERRRVLRLVANK